MGSSERDKIIKYIHPNGNTKPNEQIFFTQILKANTWEQIVVLWSCCQTNIINKDYWRPLHYNLKVLLHFYTSVHQWHQSQNVPPSFSCRMPVNYFSLVFLCTEKKRSTSWYKGRWNSVPNFKHSENFFQTSCFICITPFVHPFTCSSFCTISTLFVSLFIYFFFLALLGQ